MNITTMDNRSLNAESLTSRGTAKKLNSSLFKASKPRKITPMIIRVTRIPMQEHPSLGYLSLVSLLIPNTLLMKKDNPFE